MIVQKPYPYKVCYPCGAAANVLTCLAKYGDLPYKAAFDNSTYNHSICDVCGRDTQVTEARDFFYPDFTLLNKSRWQKAINTQVLGGKDNEENTNTVQA